MNKLVQSLCLLLTSSCFADLMQNPPASLEPGEYIWQLTDDGSDSSVTFEMSLQFRIEDVEILDPPGSVIREVETQLINFSIDAKYEDFQLSLSSDDQQIESLWFVHALVEPQFTGIDGWILSATLNTDSNDLITLESIVDVPSQSGMHVFQIPGSNRVGISQLTLVPSPNVLTICALGLIQRRRRS